MNSLTLEERLNQDCFCIDVDPAQVWAAVEQAAAGVVPVELLKQHLAHLFSSAPVFLSQGDLTAMS
jgi:DNA-binding FrmR family transcriptional regulator